jgi:hypothetical protein
VARGGAYKPGTREKYTDSGKMSENRYAWVRTILGQMVLYRHVEEPLANEPTVGDTLQLMMPRPGGRAISMNFSALTLAELEAIREFFNLLFDLATPVVKARDKVAQDAFDAGDDSYARIYRQVPQLIIRKGPVGQHRQGVHDGPEDAAAGDEHDGDLDGGLRGRSAGVAPVEEEDPGTEVDGSEAD